MAFVVADRVKETSTSTGTGTITLAGAVTGFQSFAAVGNGNTTYYCIASQSANEWEVGLGTYTSSGTTLARTTVLSSSNGGSLVNFSAGTKDVFVTYPAGYSVYSDGTRASGTWAINISGNAATATTATALTGGDSNFYGLLYNALSGDLNTYNNPGLISAEYTGSTNRPTASNGHYIQISDAGGTDVKTQWYFPSSGVTPYMRLMWGNANWLSWQALLTSGNYSGYSNFSGAVYGTIFYDYNDTGYYLDPNSTSNSALRIRGGALHGPNPTWGAYLYVGTDGTPGTSYASVCTTNGNLHLDAVDGYAIYLNNYSTNSYTIASQSIRSPIFYDLNNTGYYVDPASTSNLNGLTVASTISGSISGNAATATNISNTGTVTLATATESNSIYITAPSYTTDQPVKLLNFDWYSNVFSMGNIRSGATPSNGFGFYYTASGGSRTEIARFDTTGYLTSYTSFRAPIFYDSNNTGYYVDPAGTSNLNGLTVASTISGSISGTAATATNIANGAANRIPYQTGSSATAFIAAPTSSSTYLQWNGTAFTWAAAGGSAATITNDTSTNATYYPSFLTATSGSLSDIRVSSTKLTFNPSTGALTSTSLSASSDERLKTNWRDLPEDFISRLAQVKHGVYDRTDAPVTQVGVSGQSLALVLEHAVVKQNDGMLAVEYGNAALVACIELAKEVVELKKILRKSGKL